MAEQNEEWKIRRRDFLRLIGGGAITLSAGNLLAGCGGGSTEGGTSKRVTGSVNVSQFGGSSLTILSAHQPDAPVSVNGEFSTFISAQGTQLHILADASGKLRGLSLTNAGASPAQVSVDAASTALALVFITPGILSTTPSEFSQRFAQIQALTSFPPLVNYLAQNLAIIPLSDLRQTIDLDNLIAACVNEWSSTSGRLQGYRATRDAGNANFTAAWGSGDAQHQQILLANGAWRKATVVRQDLDPDGNELRPATLLVSPDPMDGATGVTWGSIVDLSLGNPTTKTVTINLQDIPNISSVKVWVRGTGLKSGVPVPPSVAAISDTDAFIDTLVYYAFYPVVDLLIGKFSLAEKSINADLYALIYAKAVTFSDLKAAIEEGDIHTAATKLTDIFATILTTIFSALAGDVVGEILTVASAAFGLANFIKALNTWLHYPNATEIELIVSSAGVIVQ